MALLTKAQILKADDKKRQLVQCPEWGGDVYVRTISGTERDAFEQAIVGGDGKTRNWQNVRARLAALTVTGDNGALLFTDADVTALGHKSAKALDRIFGVAMELNGLRAEDIEELAKNSASAPSGASTSGSQPSSVNPSDKRSRT